MSGWGQSWNGPEHTVNHQSSALPLLTLDWTANDFHIDHWKYVKHISMKSTLFVAVGLMAMSLLKLLYYHCSQFFSDSPWYNHHGWLVVQKQLPLQVTKEMINTITITNKYLHCYRPKNQTSTSKAKCILNCCWGKKVQLNLPLSFVLVTKLPFPGVRAARWRHLRDDLGCGDGPRNLVGVRHPWHAWHPRHSQMLPHPLGQLPHARWQLSHSLRQLSCTDSWCHAWGVDHAGGHHWCSSHVCCCQLWVCMQSLGKNHLS